MKTFPLFLDTILRSTELRNEAAMSAATTVNLLRLVIDHTAACDARSQLDRLVGPTVSMPRFSGEALQTTGARAVVQELCTRLEGELRNEFDRLVKDEIPGTHQGFLGILRTDGRQLWITAVRIYQSYDYPTDRENPDRTVVDFWAPADALAVCLDHNWIRALRAWQEGSGIISHASLHGLAVEFEHDSRKWDILIDRVKREYEARMEAEDVVPLDD